MKTQKLVILGGGMAGTMMANKLRKRLGPEWSITVVDRDNIHVYQPGLLFLPFGIYRKEEIVRERASFLGEGIAFREAEIERLDPVARQVFLQGGDLLSYDLLVVATGCRITPEATPGLTEAGWLESAFDFYTLEGAEKLTRALQEFQGGRLVLNIADMPIKCPVAPMEFLFLADHYFQQAGIRDRVELIFATPLDAAFTKPRAAQELGHMLQAKNIKIETNFTVSRVDGQNKVLHGFGDRVLNYDLLISVPVHAGSEWIRRSGLGDDFGFLHANKHTLQVEEYPGIFALGDTTDLPTSKAGSVAHFQGDVLIENIQRYLEGRELKPDFDGHANCFIETGYGKGLLIDFNYEVEPLPGKFPLPGIGPFSLLKESAINHWGKMGFKWVYWNLLLTGQDLPLGHALCMDGKRP
ncbi:NAD(P)/FAD-dependent oxidoreductase [bacterium]|nr:NAD(P)/FAD-dependent oxidoreductase [bacterium]